ncbi:metallophosphoesterase [Litorilituus lipolyticus]|uniref:metallophosphoesterase n=1 Tax=Litorilituus lipolyticus TaxID=2491017 RepID=UPI002482FC29|nr:metallophosphoesterase [Litorilituus lipolyticus]
MHGNLDCLNQVLKNESFDFNNDRLFALGDIIDRGSQSEYCFALLNEPWFFSVLGNHEAMFLEQYKANNFSYLNKNIGNLWIEKWQNKKSQLEQWAHDINNNMPLTITLDYDGFTTGLVHAKAPQIWPTQQGNKVPIEQCNEQLWDREDFYKLNHLSAYQGTDLILMGHNPVKKITLRGNRIWLDTNHGAGNLSIVNVKKLVALFRK